jgi:hypothetical protein
MVYIATANVDYILKPSLSAAGSKVSHHGCLSVRKEVGEEEELK